METARLSHAYIIAGPPEQGERLARRLAQTMVCAAPAPDGTPCGSCTHCRKVEKGLHPDLLTISRRMDEKGKPKREIYVEQIREAAASAAVLPNEAARKVYIVLDAGAMNPAAQNAFLKLLEDPPPFDAFLLVAEHVDELLETVRSRCQILRLEGDAAISPEARDLAERFLDLVAARAGVPLLNFTGNQEDLRPEELGEFLGALRRLTADALCGRIPNRGLCRRDLMDLALLAGRGEEYLRFNVSTKHILGMLAAETALRGKPL